jgi:hypothetical protein
MPVAFYGYEQSVTTTEESRSAGTVVGRTTTTSVYRMPDRLLLREQKDTYVSAPLGGGFSGSGLKLSKSDTKTCDWESSVYGPNGPVNQPKQRSEITRSFAWVSDAGASPRWTEVGKTETTYGYDGITRQVALQTTTKWTRQSAPSGGFAMLPSTMQTKAIRDNGTNWVATTTDSFNWDSRSGTWTADQVGSGDVGIGGGKRAGGIRSGGG